MKRSVIVVAALAAFGLCAPVLAEDAATGLVPMTEVELDQVVAGSNGELISDTIYGNTSNPRASGNGVIPTLTPGPWACVPGDCTLAYAGGSIGEFIAPTKSGGNASPDFANGTDTIKDNFGQPYDHPGH